MPLNSECERLHRRAHRPAGPRDEDARVVVRERATCKVLKDGLKAKPAGASTAPHEPRRFKARERLVQRAGGVAQAGFEANLIVNRRLCIQKTPRDEFSVASQSDRVRLGKPGKATVDRALHVGLQDTRGTLRCCALGPKRLIELERHVQGQVGEVGSADRIDRALCDPVRTSRGPLSAKRLDVEVAERIDPPRLSRGRQMQHAARIARGEHPRDRRVSRTELAEILSHAALMVLLNFVEAINEDRNVAGTQMLLPIHGDREVERDDSVQVASESRFGPCQLGARDKNRHSPTLSGPMNKGSHHRRLPNSRGAVQHDPFARKPREQPHHPGSLRSCRTGEAGRADP